MSLARMLIDAALSADLSQNELRAFLALFKQTLCYGKSNDACTTRRLAGIAHVREDRLPKALAALVDKGIFAREDDKKFNSRWSIPAEFLATSAESGIFAPTLLKNGEATQKAGEVTPENGEANPENGLHITNHTITNPTIKTSTTTTARTEVDPTVEQFDQWMLANFDRHPFTKESIHFKAASGRERRYLMSCEEVMNYPNGVDEKKAAQILDGLKPSLAQCCLKLLSIAMNKGNVKSPMGWLYQTAKKARCGQLDTNAISPIAAYCEWHQLHNPTPSPMPMPTIESMPFDSTPRQAKTTANTNAQSETLSLRRLMQEIAALNDMEKLAGSLPDVMIAKRQGMIDQVTELKSTGVML